VVMAVTTVITARQEKAAESQAMTVTLPTSPVDAEGTLTFGGAIEETAVCGNKEVATQENDEGCHRAGSARGCGGAPSSRCRAPRPRAVPSCGGAPRPWRHCGLCTSGR
jgi:hypothetical protein